MAAQQGELQRITSASVHASGAASDRFHEFGERFTSIDRKLDEISDQVTDLQLGGSCEFPRHCFRAEFDPEPLANMLDMLSTQYAQKTSNLITASMGNNVTLEESQSSRPSSRLQDLTKRYLAAAAGTSFGSNTDEAPRVSSHSARLGGGDRI